jgi:hypothetical protein
MGYFSGHYNNKAEGPNPFQNTVKRYCSTKLCCFHLGEGRGHMKCSIIQYSTECHGVQDRQEAIPLLHDMNEHHIEERTQQTQHGKDYGQHTGSEQSFTHDPTQSAGLTLKARPITRELSNRKMFVHRLQLLQPNEVRKSEV